MTEERYNRDTNQWETIDERSVSEIADDIYEQVGQRFPIRWEHGHPIVDFEQLPEGVSEQDVRRVIRNTV